MRLGTSQALLHLPQDGGAQEVRALPRPVEWQAAAEDAADRRPVPQASLMSAGRQAPGLTPERRQQPSLPAEVGTVGGLGDQVPVEGLVQDRVDRGLPGADEMAVAAEVGRVPRTLDAPTVLTAQVPGGPSVR